MQATYPARFEREMGCTEREWLQWLPAAVSGAPLALDAGEARVTIGEGLLRLRWIVLTPREIALIRLPRLSVAFQFVDVDLRQRDAFMRCFDLHMQRGGG